MSIVMAFSLGYSGSGCSLLLVEGPPSQGLEEEVVHDVPIRCTTDYGFPALDVLFTGLHLASVVYLSAQNTDRSDRKGLNPGLTIALDLAFTGLFGASAVVGFSRVGECRKTRENEDIPENAAVRERQADRMREWERRRFRQLHAPASPPDDDEPPTPPSDPFDGPAR